MCTDEIFPQDIHASLRGNPENLISSIAAEHGDNLQRIVILENSDYPFRSDKNQPEPPAHRCDGGS
jgi:hypothetical protein